MVAFANGFVDAVNIVKFAFVVDDEEVFFTVDGVEALSDEGDKG